MTEPPHVLFVTAVYDIYGGASDAPPSSRTDAIWARLASMAPGLSRLHVFSDAAAPIELPGATSSLLPLEATATFQALAGVQGLPPHRSVAKDTAAYLKLQCTKVEFMHLAALQHPGAAALVWIDAGISKILPTSDAADLARCLSQDAHALIGDGDVAVLRGPTIIVPGCWSQQRVAPAAMAEHVRWRFCGGLCFVPRSLVEKFFQGLVGAAREIAIATGRLTWEVNVWELLEGSGKVPFEWQPGDHDASMFRFLHLAILARERQLSLM